jgi:hypothetical protein
MKYKHKGFWWKKDVIQGSISNEVVSLPFHINNFQKKKKILIRKYFQIKKFKKFFHVKKMY